MARLILAFMILIGGVAVAADPVAIRVGRDPVAVEVAVTPAERAIGLMHRTELADGRGMLFLYDPPRPVGMWMKNTLIPLDMIFIGPDHRIAAIAADRQPHDLRVVRGPGPVAAVLEVPAGTAARLNWSVGDPVTGGPLAR